MTPAPDLSDGQAPEPEPAKVTTADLLAVIVDIRCALARIGGMLDSSAARRLDDAR